jgi:hypothetical protein
LQTRFEVNAAQSPPQLVVKVESGAGAAVRATEAPVAWLSEQSPLWTPAVSTQLIPGPVTVLLQ